jgi:hypothetical protein
VVTLAARATFRNPASLPPPEHLQKLKGAS